MGFIRQAAAACQGKSPPPVLTSGSKPGHENTGTGGYFGNRGSSRDLRQRVNVEVFVGTTC
jgi:hypothetical protein